MAENTVRTNDLIYRDLNVSLPSYKRNVSGGYTLDNDDWMLLYMARLEKQLKQLNAVFACHNAQDIPNILRRIDKNTKKRPRKKVKK